MGRYIPRHRPGADSTRRHNCSSYVPTFAQLLADGLVLLILRPHFQPFIQSSEAAFSLDNLASEIVIILAPEITAETEDGYTGTLKLDYNSVQAEVKGYKTSTRSLSASRTYPNLSDAGLSLVPKTVQEGGRTLNLADVKWSSSTDMEGEDMVVRYTATATVFL